MSQKPTYEELEQRIRDLEKMESRRTQVEEELRESEQFVTSLLKAIPLAIFFKDKEGKYISCNDTFSEIMGVTDEEITGKTVYDLWPGEHAKKYHEKDLELIKSGEHQEYEFVVQDKNGQIRPVIYMKDVFCNAKGEIAGLVGGFLDITERKHAETVLLEREEKHRKLISNISDVIAILDHEGTIVYKSPNITEQFGWLPDDLIRKHGLVTVHKDDKERIEKELSKILNKESKKVCLEYKYLCKDGSTKPIELTAVNMLDDPIVKGVLVNYKDITERKLSEKKLKQSEKKYRTMIEHSNDMVWTLDTLGNFTFMNRQTEEVSGLKLKEWLGKSFAPLIMEEDLPMIMDIFKRGIEGEPVQYELRFRKQNNELLTISVNTAPLKKDGEIIGLVSFGRDITEQKRFEKERANLAKQLQQAQKMEAIGTLAGGIAHDFNNILSGIFGFSQLAEMHIDNPERAKSDIRNIVKGAYRASELIQQILTFSRKTEYEKQYLDLSVIVKEVLKLIRSTIPATIEIKEKVISKASIYADPIQMHQVIMNLCTNAYHAMSDSGGELIVRLSEKYMLHPTNGSMLNVNQKYLELEVSDTGYGIDENTMEKIFDPYFTTKNVEKGTGLGLALVRAIVEEHGGTIKVNSTVSKGSTFLIYLPIAEKKENANKENANKENSFKEKSPNGTESILFVDDEKGIRSFVQDFLGNFDYTVTVSENGLKAYEKFKQAPQNFDIVITDMAMPKMSGEEFALKIMEIRKDIPIILCTGYTEKLNKERAEEMGITRFIDKPIAGKELCFLIREVLDESKNS